MQDCELNWIKPAVDAYVYKHASWKDFVTIQVRSVSTLVPKIVKISLVEITRCFGVSEYPFKVQQFFHVDDWNNIDYSMNIGISKFS